MFWIVGGSPVGDIIRHREVSKKLPLTAVRSGISRKLIFASCVGYFYRVYYGFKVILLLYNEKASCENEDFVETRISKLRPGCFDCAYCVGVLCDLIIVRNIG